jgi:hypothetical protein
VRHNGGPSVSDTRRIVLINAGPRAALASFTAAEELGLNGWERQPVHVLVPQGAHPRRISGIPVRLHYTARWSGEDVLEQRGIQRFAPALVLAAGSFRSPRPAVGILAAGVQQRLTRPRELRSALVASTRVRHRHALMVALDDIEQGSHALSEIDFVRLCRRFALAEPTRQGVREEPSGRRRYFDAEWRTRTGRRLVVEVDGALHLAVTRWWDDQLRQNEFVIADRVVLRFPSVVVRTEASIVADQLRRALAL